MERNENVEKLLKTIEKLGFSKDVQEQVKENMNSGLASFAAYESVRMGPDMVDYQLNFEPSKNAENPNVYLNTVDVLLNKAIPVPHKVVLGLDTQEVETLLQNKPVMDNRVSSAEEFDRMMYVHNAKVEEKMKFLADNAPEVFNALYLKYRPEMDMKLTLEMQKQQEELQHGLVKYNSFSTYYNLTKLELYNALDGGAVLKTLFKTNKGDDSSLDQDAAKDNRYKSWVQVNFGNRRPDGSYDMKMFHENRDYHLREVFSNYNFKETNDRFSRGDVIRFMEKGSKVVLTSLSEMGEKQVLARANPEFKGIDLYKLTGEPIRNVKAYLKNPLAVEVGAVVSLKRADDLINNAVRQEPMSREVRNQKASAFNQARSVFVNGPRPPSPEQKPPDMEQKKATATNAPSTTPTKEATVERKVRFSHRALATASQKNGLSK